jgi:hypothetical protein
MSIVLPKAKLPATTKSPNNLIIFSKPKVGKTSLLAELPNCLILDLESGSDYVDALKIKASSVDEIREIGKAIKEDGYPYDYIAVDTVTALETMCIKEAEKLYMKTPMGKASWIKKITVDGKEKIDPESAKLKYGSVLNLPNGQGYGYLRDAIVKVIEEIKTYAPKVILLGHVKDAMIDKSGTEVNSMDLDLTGKIKRILSSQSDAIGYLYRKGNQNILTFKTKDEISCGARPAHLKNQEIVLSEIVNDEFKTHWNKVYID